MNNWILVIIFVMWSGILYYIHQLSSDLKKLENDVKELEDQNK